MWYLLKQSLTEDNKISQRSSFRCRRKFVLFFSLALFILVSGIMRMERSSIYAVEEICAVFSVYGGKERYENEVTNSIIRLKTNNPEIRALFNQLDNIQHQKLSTISNNQIIKFHQIIGSSSRTPETRK